MAVGQKSFFQNKTQLFVAIAVILAVAVIAILIFAPSSNNSISNNSELSIGDSPVLGDVNAKVTIYEFSDFSCPFCGAAEGKNFEIMNMLKARVSGWEAPIPLIKENYVSAGKVKIVFKYFPGHGQAVAAHAVALGLNEQKPELFWKFAEKAFTAQATLNLNDLNKMKALAKDLGANETELNNYLNSKSYESQLSEDIKMGENNGVKGTPTFFINGRVVSGAESFSEFEKIIEEELSK